MNGPHGKPKLPVKQLAILAVARFSEPLALTSVFPYLPEMIESFGVDKKNVARWAGVTSGVFSVSQSAVAIPWGRAADRAGRKPIILLGLLNAMITFVIWGMTTSLPMAIVVRGLQGAGSGNVGIIRTMVAEMVREKELQPRAFSIMPMVWSLGSVFGPAFGGFFVKPAEQFPWLFGNSYYFRKFPFALPNLMLAFCFFISCSTGFLFLKETLETKRHKRDWGRQLGKNIKRFFKGRKGHAHRHHHNHQRYQHADGDSEAGPLLYKVVSNTSSTVPENGPVRRGPSPPPVKLSDVLCPQIKLTLLSYTIMALHAVAYDQVLPVFLSYPPLQPDDPRNFFFFAGGFGLSSNSIGIIFTVYGTACGLIQFLLFPAACKRWGVLNCYKGCTITFPVVYFFTPFVALIQNPTVRMAAFMFLMTMKAFCVIFAFPCITILFTNSTPDLRALATVNGFATTLSGLGRAVGPAIAGATFTWGLHKGTVVVAWWLLCLFAMISIVPAWAIVESDGSFHCDDSSSSEDEGCDDVDEATLVDPASGVRTLATGFEDDFEAVEEEEEDVQEAALLSKSLPTGHHDRHHPHHHANYSTFGAAHMRMRRMSGEGKDIEHLPGNTHWKHSRGDHDPE